ncbi:MAG TPA: hypothetical protein PKJ45_08095 [Rubrivivax sp.]|nr:hypothetical protein [Rubrivivax sp.]
MENFEAKALARARAGDTQAARVVLALAVSSIRTGGALSPALRAYLADALTLLQTVLEPSANATPAEMARALAPLGMEPRPGHRPKADEDAARLRTLELLAAVEVLAGARGRTGAVAEIAAEAGLSERAIWRRIGGSEWTGGRMRAARVARVLLARIRRARRATAWKSPTSRQ